jgi:AAA+ ATPase superfamily predicted ATPase
MTSKIIGRDRELQFFKEIQLSGKAELGIIYGRRRVGKSFLLKAITAKKKYYFEAVKGLVLQKQVEHFLKQFSEQEKLPPIKAKTWEEAFDIVTPYFKSGKIFIVFDELPWMASEKNALISLLKYYWDNKWKANNELCLVLCGSIAQFMVNHVIHSTALHNRKTFERKIKPLPSNETISFFNKKISDYERTLFLMTIGGIPKYLEQINKKLSESFQLALSL